MNTPPISPASESMTFCDEKGVEHIIPCNVAQILDAAKPIHSYLYVLLQVAGLQKGQNQSKRPKIFGDFKVISTPPPETDDSELIDECAALLEEVENVYADVQGNTRLKQERIKVQCKIGTKLLCELEQWLGVNSAGIENNDANPLLGVDMENVRIAFYYVMEYWPKAHR